MILFCEFDQYMTKLINNYYECIVSLIIKFKIVSTNDFLLNNFYISFFYYLFYSIIYVNILNLRKNFDFYQIYK